MPYSAAFAEITEAIWDYLGALEDLVNDLEDTAQDEANASQATIDILTEKLDTAEASWSFCPFCGRLRAHGHIIGCAKEPPNVVN